MLFLEDTKKDMVKLSFFDDDDAEEEEYVENAVQLPTKTDTSKFKPRKLNKDKKNNEANNKFSFNMDFAEEGNEEYELPKAKIKPKNLKFNKKRDFTSYTKSLSNNEKSEETANFPGNIKEYLQSYGTEISSVDEEGLKPIEAEVKLNDTLVDNVKVNNHEAVNYDDAQGIIIEGSDLEDDSDIERLRKSEKNIGNKDGNQLQPKTFVLTGKEYEEQNVTRRKEIEEALYQTNLNDIVAGEESEDEMIDIDSDDSKGKDKDYRKNKTLIIDMDSAMDIDIDMDYLNTELVPKAKTQLVYQSVPSFDEEKLLYEEKITTLENVLKKRQFKLTHLREEHKKLENVRLDHIKRMSQLLKDRCHS